MVKFAKLKSTLLLFVVFVVDIIVINLPVLVDFSTISNSAINIIGWRKWIAAIIIIVAEIVFFVTIVKTKREGDIINRIGKLFWIILGMLIVSSIVSLSTVLFPTVGDGLLYFLGISVMTIFALIALVKVISPTTATVVHEEPPMGIAVICTGVSSNKNSTVPPSTNTNPRMEALTRIDDDNN
ncbi:MAG: hypothetical protein LBI63_03190 [Candidatus Ancillula sp.]|jgi:hypothetical protein|nr:hypothetical protein [Candidatus Ancillula sp.]